MSNSILCFRPRPGPKLSPSLICLLLVILSLLLQLPKYAVAQETGNPDQATLVQHPERAYGYVLGDTLMQKIRLSTVKGSVELEKELSLTRIGPWLDRQNSTLTLDRDNKPWLTLTYQIVNAPNRVIRAEIPELVIVLKNHPVITVNAWPFSLGPITPERLIDGEGLPALQADMQPAIADKTAIERSLQNLLIALATTLVAWLVWWLWRYNRDKKRLPFAEAHHKIKWAGNVANHEDLDIWLILHEAFNKTVSKSLQPNGLPDLFDKKPWLRPLQTQIEQFFTASSARFFEYPSSKQSFNVQRLSRDLYQAEKRNS